MQELVEILIGIVVLFLGFPIGNLLAKSTLDEKEQGRKWFILIIFLSLIGVVVGLVLRKDWVLFTFAFFAIVTSRSIT